MRRSRIWKLYAMVLVIVVAVVAAAVLVAQDNIIKKNLCRMIYDYLPLTIYFIIANITAFFMYVADKLKALNNSFRIKETALLIVAVAGGAFGAMLGMVVANHKVRKLKFQLIVPLSFVLQCMFVIFF